MTPELELFSAQNDVELCNAIVIALNRHPVEEFKIYQQLWHLEFADDDAIDLWFSTDFFKDIDSDSFGAYFGFLSNLPEDPFNESIVAWEEMRQRGKRLFIEKSRMFDREIIFEALWLRASYIKAVSAHLAAIARRNPERFHVLSEFMVCDCEVERVAGSYAVQEGSSSIGLEEEDGEYWESEWHVRKLFKPLAEERERVESMMGEIIKHYENNVLIFQSFREMFSYPIGYILETEIGNDGMAEFLQQIESSWDMGLAADVSDLWKEWNVLRSTGRSYNIAYRKTKKKHRRIYEKLYGIRFEELYFKRWSRGWEIS